MADGTIIQVGNFVSTGAPVILQLRNGTDWIETFNYTQASGAVQFAGIRNNWQLGMPQNDCVYNYHNAATTVLSAGTCLVGPAANPGAIPGFTLVDSTQTQLSAPIAITAISVAGVVSTANTTGLVANSSVVILSNVVGGAQIGGTPFLVTAVNPGVSFTLGTLVAGGNIAVVAAPGALAVYQVVPFGPYFQPARQTITAVSQAANALVTTASPHGYVVGEEVRFNVPNIPNFVTMYQLSGLSGQIVTVPSATTFTVNIDTTAFFPFVFPLTANYPYTPAQVYAFGEGEDSSIASPNLLDDATLNTGYIGVILGAGIGSPAGQAADRIFWKAGKSFNT